MTDEPIELKVLRAELKKYKDALEAKNWNVGLARYYESDFLSKKQYEIQIQHYEDRIAEEEKRFGIN